MKETFGMSSNLGKLKGTRKIPLSDFGSDGDKL